MTKQAATAASNTNRVAGGFSAMYSVVKKGLEADLVPMLWGPPGVGKSAMAAQLAKEFGLPLVIQILSHQADPADLVGGKIPGTITVDGVQQQVLHDCIPGWFLEFYQKKQPFLLFLDEIPNSPAHATTILNSIILERRISMFKLPEGTKVMCAGNRMEDQCMVYALSAALQQRILHMEVNADVQDFTIYAKKKGFEPQIPAYVNWKGMPSLITSEGTYPRVCPRVWEMADRMLKQLDMKLDHKNLVNFLGSVVGVKTAIEFKTFIDVWHNIDLEKILKGETPDWNTMEESTKYAITFSLANEANRRYKDIKLKKTIDWKILSGSLLGRGYPASLATLFFLTLDDLPLRDASGEPAFTSYIDRVVNLLTGRA